jgi:hypothetical protein
VRGQEALTDAQKRYIVELTDAEEAELLALTRKGEVRAHKVKPAQVLLKAHQGTTDGQIMAALGVSRPMVERLRERFSASSTARAGIAASRMPTPWPAKL